MKMENKKLTKLFVDGIALTAIIFWIYQFGVFVLGYTLEWKEPNKIVAFSEMLIALIAFIIFMRYRKDEMQV